MKGIHHISLKARDEKNFLEVLDFYSNVLACPIVWTWGEGAGSGAMLDLGNTLLEVTAGHGEERKKGLFAHIAFAVDDVDEAARRVREAGRTVFLEPSDKELGPGHPVRIAFCTGPAGEDLEFFQER